MRDSPELRSTNTDSTTSFQNGTNPGTPDNNGIGFQKGWCSERVPLPNNNIKQRRASVNILMPFNNGRILPSKWDDAERWITSPMSGSSVCKALAPPPQRRLKSKSGPLGLTSGDFSPGFSLLESGRTNDTFAGSPLTTGVLLPPNGYSFHHGEIDATFSYPDSQGGSSSIMDPQHSLLFDDGNNVSRVVSRRDMATQMSPDSSPKVRRMLSTSPPPDFHLSARVEVRDVQVDKRVTMTKQQRKRTKKNGSTEVNDRDLRWNSITEGEMELSKLQKEEARITAWENLQNAKAEAAIRKLEMKLEKKKLESMDRIMKKLSIAQMKAQEMRKTNQAPKVTCLHRNPIISLTRCFVPNILKSDKSQVEN